MIYNFAWIGGICASLIRRSIACSVAPSLRRAPTSGGPANSWCFTLRKLQPRSEWRFCWPTASVPTGRSVQTRVDQNHVATLVRLVSVSPPVDAGLAAGGPTNRWCFPCSSTSVVAVCGYCMVIAHAARRAMHVIWVQGAVPRSAVKWKCVGPEEFFQSYCSLGRRPRYTGRPVKHAERAENVRLLRVRVDCLGKSMTAPCNLSCLFGASGGRGRRRSPTVECDRSIAGAKHRRR
jgi:hypothetical protein